MEQPHRGSQKSQRSNSSESFDPFAKTVLACLRCRKQKTKCSGGTPCYTCGMRMKQDPSLQCIYPESTKKVSIAENELQELRDRLAAYEAQGRSRPSPLQEQVSPAPSIGTPSASSAVEIGPNDVNPLMDGMSQIVLTPSGQRHYVGSGSSTNLGLRFSNFIKSFRSEYQDFDFEVEYPTYDSAAWPTRRPSISSFPQLPPPDVAKRLYNAQFLYIGTIFSFSNPQVFEQRLRQMYLSKPDFSDREACLSHCHVLMIFAYGQMYSINQWSGTDGPPGFSYFMQALQFLPDIHEEGSLLFVEVLSLVGYFLQNLNRRDAAFLYIGLALRMAISLGLHQELSDSLLDDDAREHRRRLWWSVYSMDRILCAKSGNPITIADEDIDVGPPSPLETIIKPMSAPATVLYHYTELSKILGRISKFIYRKSQRTGSSLAASVQSIMTELAQWLHGLPHALRFDFANPDRDMSRESVSIFLHYHQCINMTVRPLLFLLVQKRLEQRAQAESQREKGQTVDAETDWREGLSPATVAVIEACITAARNSTIMMNSAAKQNLVATYGFMDGEHAFSAAIVLVMINVAFPYNARDRAAMDMALNLLHGMAEKGNVHMRARHRLLLNLWSSMTGAPKPQMSQDDLWGGQGLAPNITTLDNPLGYNFTGNQTEILPAESFVTPAPLYVEDTAALDELFSMEATMGDFQFLEEGYGTNGMGMELDSVLAPAYRVPPETGYPPAAFSTRGIFYGQ